MRLYPAVLTSVLLASCAVSPLASAAELSFVSGLYKSEKNKVEGSNAGSESTIEAGARVGDALDQHVAWFGQGLLSLKSYSAGSGGKSPDDTTSIALGGGLKYYFPALAEHLTPFAYGMASYENNQDSEYNSSGGFSETDTNGIFYGAAVGLRFGLDNDFFVDLETTLFDSALFATEKTTTTTYDAAGKATKSDSEKTRTELYADTTGAFQEMKVALGMKF
jgi:hypothetical protein